MTHPDELYIGWRYDNPCGRQRCFSDMRDVEARKYIAYDIYNRRVTELLEANNKLVEENRKLRRASLTIPITDLYKFGSPDHPDRFIKRSDGTIVDTMEGI